MSILTRDQSTGRTEATPVIYLLLNELPEANTIYNPRLKRVQPIDKDTKNSAHLPFSKSHEKLFQGQVDTI